MCGQLRFQSRWDHLHRIPKTSVLGHSLFVAILSSKEINETYNDDRFNPKDGELVKAADSLAGFIEASVAIRNGSASPDLQYAKLSVKKQYERVNIANINFGELYADFD